MSFLEAISENKEQKLEHTASDFERNFKQLVRKQGSLCIPQATAQTMISFMNGVERKRLAETFFHIGVKSQSDLECLLDRWKNEALNPKIETEYSYRRTVKSRNVEVFRGR